ncbi:MAG: pyrroline-5-carboxylate reductase [archaeon]
MQSRIGIIGCGNMGRALIDFLMKKGVSATDIRFAETDDSRAADIVKTIGIARAESPSRLAAWGDLIILAVKPQSFPTLAQALSPLAADIIVVSIMAGITIENLCQQLGTDQAIRVMPNLALRHNSLIGGFAFGPSVEPGGKDLFMSLFADESAFFEVEERQLDTITALSGSGPAFLASAAEAMIQASVAQGMDGEQATVLALRTMESTAALLLAEGIGPAELIDQVASKGGTTEAGLATLEAGDVSGHMRKAIDAAVARSRELSSNTGDRR